MRHLEFKEKAREHQIRFKETELGISSERSPKRILRGKEIVVKSSLLYSDTKDSEGNYIIFYPGFRKEITDAVKCSKVASNQMITNLLRSEHIPYNIFFPMRHDLEGAKVLFNHILGDNRIASINQRKSKIEYNPGGLEDGTAFDVYVEYFTSDNKRGGIGIEVKYTEKEYPIKRGSKEWNETHDENGRFRLAPNYKSPSVNCKWFKDEFIKDSKSKTNVVANKFRQIWRNHLLGAAMKLNGELDEFTSLTVYPEGNVHFKEVLPEYETMLTDEGKATFKHLTYEKLFSLMEQSFNQSAIPQLKDWIAYLRKRYIVK